MAFLICLAEWEPLPGCVCVCGFRVESMWAGFLLGPSPGRGRVSSSVGEAKPKRNEGCRGDLCHSNYSRKDREFRDGPPVYVSAAKQQTFGGGSTKKKREQEIDMDDGRTEEGRCDREGATVERVWLRRVGPDRLASEGPR